MMVKKVIVWVAGLAVSMFVGYAVSETTMSIIDKLD